jgi:hypothetical protein
MNCLEPNVSCCLEFAWKEWGEKSPISVRMADFWADLNKKKIVYQVRIITTRAWSLVVDYAIELLSRARYSFALLFILLWQVKAGTAIIR